MRFALTFEDHVAFRLRVFLGAPTPTAEGGLDGVIRFDSGCLSRESTTFEINDLPVGSNYAVVYEAWDEAGCEGATVAMGFRGDVSVADGDRAFVHLPVYARGQGTALPLDLNLSALSAAPVDSCESASCDGALESCLDFDGSAWCVPTCEVDSDCTAIHPQAVCDAEARWCMLATPFPLNASEARAFGRAVTRPDGDVVFIGGLRTGTAGLTATRFALETFDAQSGVFAGLDVSGFDGRPAWGFGFSQHGDGAIVVGGLREVDALRVADGRPVAEGSWWRAGVESAWVIDFATGKAVSMPLGVRLSEPSVLVLGEGRFLIAGGRVATAPTAGGVEAPPDVTTQTFLCTLAEGGASGACRSGPPLLSGRVAPALRCVAGETACDRVLVLGGVPAGAPVAELLSLEGELSGGTLEADGLPEAGLTAPVLCGDVLVSGVDDAGAPVVSFTLDLSGVSEGRVGVLPVPDEQGALVTPIWGAHGADGCGLVLGGLAADGAASSSAWEASEGRLTALPGSLAAARVGAAAGRVGSGPLAGTWVIMGGATPEAGVLTPLAGAEIWLP